MPSYYDFEEVFAEGKVTVAAITDFDILYQFVQEFVESPESAQLQLVAPNQELSTLGNKPHLAGQLQERVEQGTVSVRQHEGIKTSAAVLGNSDAVLALSAEGDVETVSVPGHSTRAIQSVLNSLFGEGATYQLEFPALTQAVGEAELALGTEYSSSLVDVFEMCEAHDISAVTGLVLLGATQNRLFKPIYTFGEKLGIASMSTFSAHKNKLETEGVIEIEEVEQDVGRPAHRLRTQDQATDIETLVAGRAESQSA